MYFFITVIIIIIISWVAISKGVITVGDEKLQNKKTAQVLLQKDEDDTYSESIDYFYGSITNGVRTY